MGIKFIIKKSNKCTYFISAAVVSSESKFQCKINSQTLSTSKCFYKHIYIQLRSNFQTGLKCCLSNA